MNTEDRDRLLDEAMEAAMQRYPISDEMSDIAQSERFSQQFAFMEGAGWLLYRVIDSVASPEEQP